MQYIFNRQVCNRTPTLLETSRKKFENDLHNLVIMFRNFLSINSLIYWRIISNQYNSNINNAFKITIRLIQLLKPVSYLLIWVQISVNCKPPPLYRIQKIPPDTTSRCGSCHVWTDVYSHLISKLKLVKRVFVPEKIPNSSCQKSVLAKTKTENRNNQN